jgi:hypothetical protein
MKTLLIGNFRSGTWFLHDKLVSKNNLFSFKEIFYGNEDNINKKLDEFTNKENCIAKIFPIQLNSKEDNILRICSKFCRSADNIIYTQRKNTREQTISYAVASLQSNSLDTTPWLRNRNLYKNKLSEECLNNAFNRLQKNDILIKKLFDIFPGKVYTLEKDFDFDPYPNKYDYKGKWQNPYNFEMLGE